jgi:NADPH-dependent 2,4-dienoyl-CoA reductase/sulfur reductase-like enzyme
MTRFRGNWDTGERRNFRRILVVGGGRAGVATAEELRRQGFGGEIVVMCDEVDAPYDRPSCSKGLLSGKKRPRDARMPVQDDLAIQWDMGRHAVHLDPINRVVVADTNEEYRYDGLVIATGARPLWPEGWPRGEPGLHQLHGLADAWKLRNSLQRAKRVAVVGGGLTGCEVACTVRSLARECVLIDSKQQVMSRPLGEVVGRYVTEEVAKDGVELRLGRRVRRLERRRRGWILVLDDASEVEADVVVATIGERPDTRWLASSGFDVSDGVLCDENLRVVGAEDVVAAGTVARWPNLRYSTKAKRVGQWIMALEQGRAAAAALLRSDHPARPAALVPRFWSEQFGLRIQVCGEVPTDGSAEMTVSRQRPGRRDTAKAGVLIGYHRNGEQIGLVGVNAVRAFTTTARMMLAAPPTLVDQEYHGPPMLAAGPAHVPVQGGRLAIGPGPVPLSPVPREQIAIEAAPGPAYDYGAPPAQPAPYGYQQPAPGPEYGYEQPTQAPNGYGYEPGPAPMYDYGQQPAPEPNGPQAYDPQAYGPQGYDPQAYDPQAYDPQGYDPQGYGPQAYDPQAYGPQGYDPQGYDPQAYDPQGYGPPAAVPHDYGQPPAPAQYDYGPGSAPGYDYEPAPPPPDYQQPAPVSPARPVSPPPRRGPRDRFATDQFAAVR